MHVKQILVVSVAVVMAFSVIGPAAAADRLDVSVSQDGDDVMVSVTENGTQNSTAVEGATVTVDGPNTTYGDYVTGDEGTVELPAPEDNVTAHIVASVGNRTGSITAHLTADSTGNKTTVPAYPVEFNANETLDDGTVNYSNVSVEDSVPFGLYVRSLVHTAVDTNPTNTVGQIVAPFATTFNPGHGTPEHAGPPANVTRGPPENVTRGPPENVTRGPPENIGSGEDDAERGPPSDVEPRENDARDEEAEDGTRGEGDRRRGPPSHARGGR